MSDTEASARADNRDSTTVKEAPSLLLKGFLMGSADIIPGVSGGTMAFILGIYERLLKAINSVDGVFFKSLLRFDLKAALGQFHWLFLGVLFAGITSAAVFFTRVVPLQIYMFTHPEIVFGLFFGLIVGSIFILIKALERRRWIEIVFVLVGLAIGLWVVTLVPTETPNHPAFVFLTGVIAISAMILPGISGSFLLLIMRKYDFVLTQISKMTSGEFIDGLIGILPFTLGSLTGIALFSRFLSWLLARFHSQTIAVLIGFLIGSLYVIWPFQHRDFVEQVRETERVEQTSPIVSELRNNPMNEHLPEFRRLVPSMSDGDDVEIQTVKKKLIKSDPYLPGIWNTDESDEPNVWGGITGMLIGGVLVIGLERLREVT
ncbi:MAG: DUF368 domain-containing protein [Bacteroidota bacterium]